MFKCEKCGKVTESGEKLNKKVIKTSKKNIIMKINMEKIEFQKHMKL